MINTLTVVALGLLAADWNNLKEITRDTSYSVALRDGQCLKGRLISSNDRQLVLDSRVANREEILRVLDVGPYIGSSVPVYSGRSSWADVKDSGAADLLIVTKNSEQQRWAWAEIFADRIVLKGNRSRRPISRPSPLFALSR